MARRISSASVPRGWSGKSMPPVAASRTSGPAMPRASSATPSASLALCETMTRLTMALSPTGQRQAAPRAIFHGLISLQHLSGNPFWWAGFEANPAAPAGIPARRRGLEHHLARQAQTFHAHAPARVGNQPLAARRPQPVDVLSEMLAVTHEQHGHRHRARYRGAQRVGADNRQPPGGLWPQL